MSGNRIAPLLLLLGSFGCLALPRASHADDNSAAGILLAPKAFRAAAEKVLPSIVRIETFGGLDAATSSDGPGEGPTTGVIVSSDGLIVTSTFNFLKKPPIITVILPGEQRKVAQLLGRDDTRKICLLKVEAAGLPVPEFLPREQIRVGQWAISLGVGFGDKQPALSAGMISATSRISGKAVQTDANLSPANYGGPLIDIEGRVIGICSPLSPNIREEAAGNEWYDSGIGFAVPLAGADQLLADLKEGKRLQPPFLGIQAKPHGDPPSGVMIAGLVPGGPAEKAGLKAEDKILTVAGAPVLDPTHMQVLLNRHYAGDEIELGIQRGEEQLTIQATLATVPPPEKPKKPDPKAKPMPKPDEKPPGKPQ